MGLTLSSKTIHWQYTCENICLSCIACRGNTGLEEKGICMLVKAASQSLVEQLAERFAERIRTGLLAPGTRLPSVRQCAQQQGVSPSTVVAAYDQLLAQGLVEALKNRGFHIRNRAVATVNSAYVATNSIVTGDVPTKAKTTFEE